MTYEEQKALSELMKDGWSYRRSHSGSGSAGIMIDPSTGKHYILRVEDGDLHMTEVDT